MIFGLFTQRVDKTCLTLAGRAVESHFKCAIRSFCSMHDVCLEELDETIRQTIECQMFVVSLSTSLLNFALIEAYYSAGKASPVEGMPKIKFTHDDGRLGLREAWAVFPTCRPNLDMRYRYICVQKLNSPQEQVLWEQMERWSEYYAQQVYVYRQPLSLNWLSFVLALRNRDVPGAQRYVSDLYAD